MISILILLLMLLSSVDLKGEIFISFSSLLLGVVILLSCKDIGEIGGKMDDNEGENAVEKDRIIGQGDEIE